MWVIDVDDGVANGNLIMIFGYWLNDYNQIIVTYLLVIAWRHNNNDLCLCNYYVMNTYISIVSSLLYIIDM